MGNLGLATWASYHPKPTLCNPRKVPDAVLTIKQRLCGSWYDVVIPMEYDKQNEVVEGSGQAVSYMSIALAKKASRERCISIFSDYQYIRFMAYDATASY